MIRIDVRSIALVARREHGTAMASLILHGDLNAQEPPLSRLLYVRPLLLTNTQGAEQSDENRLLVDTVHRAVLRMRGSEGEEAAASQCSSSIYQSAIRDGPSR